MPSVHPSVTPHAPGFEGDDSWPLGQKWDIPLFHMTRIENLESIQSEGCLWSDADCAARGLVNANMAHSNIKEQRASTQVPLGPRGFVSDYVPFYFAPCSPMLSAIYHRKVASCPSQAGVVYLVSSVREVTQRPFVIADGRVVSSRTTFGDDLKHLDEIDWDVMRLKYWKEHKHLRQAEYLVHRSVPAKAIRIVAARTEEDLERAQDEFGAGNPVYWVRPNWYF